MTAAEPNGWLHEFLKAIREQNTSLHTKVDGITKRLDDGGRIMDDHDRRLASIEARHKKKDDEAEARQRRASDRMWALIAPSLQAVVAVALAGAAGALVMRAIEAAQ